MTEQDFLDLVTTSTARTALTRLSAMPAKDRRAFAKPALSLFKKLDRVAFSAPSATDPKVRDADAVTVAVLATATASDLKKMSFLPLPGHLTLEEVVRALEPDWLQAVVDHFVEVRVFYVETFRPLWQAGLCARPESDAIILGYYRYMATLGSIDEEALLGGDVWRFFDVEGGGEDSLANHDKYLKSGQENWAERLKRYADTGKLDRQRLLDASLDALERDFGQYRAGWYSRFHVLLAPDPGERAARASRYLRLLSSSVPPTVSFALKHVQALDKAGALDPEALLAALDPALQARAKGTVAAALKLLASAVKRQPALAAQAASKAVLALISEDAGIQGKALDTIEALGAEAVSAELAEYAALVAPSVRPRIAALTGSAVAPAGQADPDAAPATPAVEQPVSPVASAEDALALYLSMLEEPRDPIAVERAVDGLSRFGPVLQADSTVLSPLRKRAGQICKSPDAGGLRFVLALTARGFTEGAALDDLYAEMRVGQGRYIAIPDLSLQEVHLARNAALVARVSAGHALPLLSLPSGTSGMVRTRDLVARMALYRAASVAPDPSDLALALMRLHPEDRASQGLPTETEADRALVYALGGKVEVGPTPELWAAAWRARLPERADRAVSGLFPAPLPDCGVPAQMALTVETERSRDGEYTWIDVDVEVTPANTSPSRALPALFGIRSRKHHGAACCGHSFADIAWASLTRPADPEPFFRIGLIQQDTWQKLTDNPTRAYLEPFFRPGPPVGPLGAAVLAYYMACEDKSVSSLAAEATATLAAGGRLTAERFAAALKPFLLSQTLPTGRWTAALKTVADLGSPRFAREAIVGLLDFDPADAPHGIGGLLELCYELHVAQNAVLEDAAAIACLKSIPGGGKTARFRKRILDVAA